jgi:SAM-dependent methyltransferase
MQLTFPDNHFDFVVAASLLNVVTTPLTALTEMCRVSRNGGVVSVLVPNLAFTDGEAKRYLESEKLSGISRAAFIMWHRLGKKMDINLVRTYFGTCGMTNITTNILLGGMAVSITGVVSKKIQ